MKIPCFLFSVIIMIYSYCLRAQPVSPDFTFTINCATVTFSDQTQTAGYIESWQWDFGDGLGFDTVQNPIYTYPVPGNYYVTLSVTDTVYGTWHMPKGLSINPASVSTNSLSICLGDSIFADGSYQTATGVFLDTFVTTGGCDSIIITNLSVIQIPVSNLNITICQGDSAYINGIWRSTAGVNYDTLLSSSNGCDSIIASNLDVVTDVWPGDANNDLIANNNDLLPVGLYFGETGTSRFNASNSWTGQCSFDWATSQSNGSNKKHVDCNGDGVINDSDTLAINLNYGLTHSKAEGSPTPAVGPILTLVPRSSIYQPGDSVILDIVLGDNTTSVSELYGIAFNLSFDNSMAEPGTVQLSYTNSWLGNIANNLKLGKIIESTGKADGALTRTDHQNSSGHGTIGVLQFVANSNINSLQSSTVSITNYEAVKANGDTVLFAAQDGTFTIDGTSGINSFPNGLSSFNIYPNPFTTSTTIEFALKINSKVILKVYDVVGRVVFESASSQKTKGIHHIQFENSASRKGLLIVELNMDGVKIRKRIVQIQ